MSRENNTSQEPWKEPVEKDGYEGKTQFRRRPRSSRDAYDDPSARTRQRSHQTGDPRDTGKNRPGPYEERPRRQTGPSRANDPRQRYDAYGQPRQSTRPRTKADETTTESPKDRPRQTRDSRERPGPPDKADERSQQRHRLSRHSREEAYERLRQRPRQPGYSREEVYGAYHSTQQRSRPLNDPEIEELDRRALRPRPRTQTTQLPVRRQRRVWSTLLIGCLGGVITIALILAVIAFVFLRNVPINIGGIGKTTFSKQLPQRSLPITANVTQLQVHNRVGNISIMVDPGAKQGAVNGVMKVQAGNSSDAEKEFGRISVDVKTGSDPTTVNATVPDTSGGLLTGSSDSVDLSIVLPEVSKNPTSPFKLNVDISAAGDISVQNFNGLLLTLTDNMGNITVKRGLLVEGSCLQTHIGNITFNGSLTLDANTDAGRIPCTTNTTQNPHPWYSFKSGTGNVNVTLSAETINVTLDANTNNGKINSGEFGLKIQQNSDGSASYYGPLTQGGTSPPALLALTVSTGNINLHKSP